MTMHPYKTLPKTAFWRSSVSQTPPDAVDPIGPLKFTISNKDKVMTAGSCFAQHIARYLKNSGFEYLVTENAHPLLSKYHSEKSNYGTFTARYANIYTTRQMLQLLRRAYGLFKPQEDRWANGAGGYLDPFRPQIQPGGFSSIDEYEADRTQHFGAVRQAIEELDVFVFTLGLTECWMSSIDGAVFPLCPGTSGGEFKPEEHNFYNMTVLDVMRDLEEIKSFIDKKNRYAKFILTVSPVPLAATACEDHVLTATVHSKSVLRAAAGEFASRHDDVAYFPSYEIITGSFNRGNYFADDLRSVTEDGVGHVMNLFLKHYGGLSSDKSPDIRSELHRPTIQNTEEIVRVICEEEALSQFQ
ncbi:GSCFA family protein [Methylobacterium sp. ap11]|uniref:GSCFA domain-containing protein n=1 Tax=Methylobacterium sp. ap11 TaxID=1761799 RepID=UPI0008C8B736|nr:GSCFA domain-containing protein [Methylobacterium sp. ap11]SEO88201.1 GSCFA family protein [Methylobacterium sp. ap11]